MTSARHAVGVDGAAANLRAALSLLATLRACGLRHAVLCPGSRSAPLALAAALLEPSGLRLHTAIDERSAAFYALALGRAEGVAAAVLTTSGSAVAQLLPACVEADHGAIPLLLLSADRPQRLKGCGANQSVNQETFLIGSCRWFGQGCPTGLGAMPAGDLEALSREAWRRTLAVPSSPDAADAGASIAAAPPGPVHLNLPFEEPLHATAEILRDLEREIAGAPAPGHAAATGRDTAMGRALALSSAALLDPARPGVVVAGPWRGSAAGWPAYSEALIAWQRLTGWPVLADALSALRGLPGLDVISAYDLLLESPSADLAVPQVLRLGSLPASRRLERWLAGLAAHQVLVSEGDPRPLDPLGVVAAQEACGLASWLGSVQAGTGCAVEPSPATLDLRQAWWRAEATTQALLERELAASAWSEPLLARRLSQLLPQGLPLMLANSSPVRDWETFAHPAASSRPVFGFRGASGIDGTLSEACGLAEALGACLLVSGDLALLHDSNGWLWRPRLSGRLTVVLIDNGGGGIFEQLPIRAGDRLDFDRLFAMPQALDPLALAVAHGVPAREITDPEALAEALAWALAHPFSLLLVRTDRRRDADLRRRLRTMAAQATTP